MSEILAKMNTGLGFDAMTKILPYLKEFLDDKELSKAYARASEDKDATLLDVAMVTFPRMVAEHRAAIYGIVGAVTGKTAEEIDQQPLEETMEVFTGATGKQITGFFIAFARMAMRT